MLRNLSGLKNADYSSQYLIQDRTCILQNFWNLNHPKKPKEFPTIPKPEDFSVNKIFWYFSMFQNEWKDIFWISVQVHHTPDYLKITTALSFKNISKKYRFFFYEAIHSILILTFSTRGVLHRKIWIIFAQCAPPK